MKKSFALILLAGVACPPAAGHLASPQIIALEIVLAPQQSLAIQRESVAPSTGGIAVNEV